MPLTEAEIKNAPSISIGGKPWHIPPLAIKQNRVVIGALQKLLPLMGRLEAVARSLKNAQPETVSASLADFPIDESTDDLVCKVIYTALTRAYPALTIEEFEDLPMSIDERFGALIVIMAQSFAFRAKAPATEGAPAAPEGEAQPTSTGMPSSSGSAEPSAGTGTTSKAA